MNATEQRVAELEKALRDLMASQSVARNLEDIEDEFLRARAVLAAAVPKEGE